MRVPMLAAVVGCLALTPLAVRAAPCDGFSDVDSANATYCSAVAFVKDKGVTLGCSDASHYCPNDYVTRLQMALFMYRMARGGPNNVLLDATTSIGGGDLNVISGGASYASIGGGSGNQATGHAAFIGGGISNDAGGDVATIGGGGGNHTSGSATTVGGGENNLASGHRATVGGGGSNTTSGESATVAGGLSNVASGLYGTVPGGFQNVASAADSFAAGVHAQADQVRCAVFSLWSTETGMSCFGSPYIFRIAANHGFSVDYYSQRDDGGGTHWTTIGDTFAGQTISTWTGAYLSDGGIWTNNSDVAAKTDFAEVDALDVLEKVAAMPLTSWRYKTESGQRHLGPMAQDFHAAFGLGTDDKHITTLDESGVALAAIKGLNEKLETTRGELAAQRAQNEDLQQRLLALERAAKH